jgi:ketosteroid isomerase-like protein
VKTQKLDVWSRLELLELYARYTHAFDAGRADEVAALFIEDGVFLRAGSEPVRGHPALTEMVQRAHAGQPSLRQHLVTSIVLEADDARIVRGTAYVTVMSVMSDTVRVAAHGRYLDTFVEDRECWRFQQRLFVSFEQSSPEFEAQMDPRSPHGTPSR